MVEKRIAEQQTEFDFGGNQLIADSGKALFWKKHEALILSDVHLGKIFHFRKNGIPIPVDMMEQPYRKLDLLLKKYNPEVVYFLGDLFHSSHNQEWNYLIDYFNSYPEIEFVLIAGNHDVSTLKYYRDSSVTVIEDELVIGNLVMTHHPPEKSFPENIYYISGHVHPAVSVKSGPKQSVRLPCFYFSGNVGILPAFGDFTGSYKIRPKKNDHVLAILGGRIIHYSKKST